jgi:hypothetical protein
MSIRKLVLAGMLTVLSVAPALSDPYSSRLSQREKERHEFRDVQRGYVPHLQCRRNTRPHGAAAMPRIPANGKAN